MRRRRGTSAPRPATLLGALAAAVLLGLTTAGCGSGGSAGAVAADDTLAGVAPPKPRPRPAFTLSDTAGRPYDFGTRTAGRLTYLYFGYTSCDDECPTTMADLAAALRTLSPRERRAVDVVFVTVDPGRDSGPVLRRWLDRFDPGFVGLTGTPAQLAAAQRAAAVPVGGPPQAHGTALGEPAVLRTSASTVTLRQETLHKGRPSGTPSPGAGGGYDVGHFSALLTYDTDDRLRVLYPSGTSPDDLVADLPTLLEGRAS